MFYIRRFWYLFHSTSNLEYAPILKVENVNKHQISAHHPNPSHSFSNKRPPRKGFCRTGMINYCAFFSMVKARAKYRARSARHNTCAMGEGARVS